MSIFFPIFLIFLPIYFMSESNATPWQEATGARARLVVGHAEGARYAALEIDLDKGWHTYWRFPGASGLPPELDWSQSVGVEIGETIFPAPRFFDDGAGGFNGYEADTGFAAPLRAQDNAKLVLHASLGVCREICVPVRFDFALDVADAPTHDAFIEGILAARPQSPSPVLAIGAAWFDGETLNLRVVGENLHDVSLIIARPDDGALETPRLIAATEDSRDFALPLAAPLDPPLTGRKLTFIVRNGRRTIAQAIIIAAHPPEDTP